MTLLFSILFRVVAYGLAIAAIWYTPFRFSRLFGMRRAWPLCTVIAVVVIFAAVGMHALNPFANLMVGAVATAAGLFIGLFIYSTLLMLCMDIVKRWLRFSNRTIARSVLGLALLLTLIGTWQANDFKVTEIEIPVAGLKKDVTLMHIPDIHIGHHRGRAYLEKIVSTANQYHPDLVLLNGDLVDSNAALVPGVLSPLEDFKAPVYFTTGNHEHYVDMEKALKVVADHGARILHNEVIQTHGFQLIGLDYMNADENTFDMHAVNKLTIKEELPKIPIIEGLPVILMHHSPVGLDYVVKAGVDLMLSGHTHGGQMFPATLINEFIFPLNKGLHERNGTYFFVSQGAGTYGPRIRIGSSNEINLIRLRAKR